MITRFFSKRHSPDSPNHQDNGHDDDDSLVTAHERVLLNNILALRDINVYGMMIPRADIIAIDVNTPHDDVLNIISQSHVSRLPVFQDNLDNILGTIHIKDFIKALTTGDRMIRIADHIIDVPIVSPAMPALDLILEMRKNKRHMVMVVDEYGGIDGLITLGDIIETIIGVIDDEHDTDTDDPQMTRHDDGSLIADARIDISDFETQYGEILSTAERGDIETLGGLAYALAGRIPNRGEILKHDSGMSLEILEADPRRIHKMRLRDVPEREIDSGGVDNSNTSH